MPRNRPRVEDLRHLPIGDLAELPADQLSLLQEETEEALQRARQHKEWLEGALALRYAERAAALRRSQGTDAGTVRFQDGPVTVAADLPKKVEWDQTKLAELAERIRAQGEDPEEYLEVTLKVPERRYAAWPNHIRLAFEDARTLRTGKPSFRLAIKREELGT